MDDKQKQAAWNRAKRELSYSESQALNAVLLQLNGAPEGIVIASKAADKGDFTRSVVVTTLRILAAAGLLEHKTLGTKGTYIKVLWTGLQGEARKLAA